MLDTIATDIVKLATNITGSAPVVGVKRGKVLAVHADRIVTIRITGASECTVTTITRDPVPSLVARETLTVHAAIVRAIMPR